MKVGFIGLGNMGGPMALNVLRAGHTLTVLDLRREAAAPHLEAGALWADSPKEVAQASEVIFTSLPGPKEVQEVSLGPDGILEGIERNAVYVDLSTSSPTLIRELSTLFLDQKGAHVLDGPVSGGVPGARTRNLAVMVGGDEVVYQRIKPVLDAIGDKVMYVGPVGSGTICKLAHNCIGYTLALAIAECFTMGVKAGVEPRAIWEAVRRGALGRASILHSQLPRTLFQGRFQPPDFALRLAHKDVDLAVSLGREFGVPMRLSSLTLQEMQEALNRGWGEMDSRAVCLLQEERAGVQLRIPGLEVE
ncbi:MAG: NAD(P)-dependent oxidoreductase [Chloroflexi bacterium]|nr:NAD(P)-dependent oxidoreductase [Chloroflexota bacterium]